MCEIPFASTHGMTSAKVRPMIAKTGMVAAQYALPVPLRTNATRQDARMGKNARKKPAAMVAQIQSPGQIPGPKTVWANDNRFAAKPSTVSPPHAAHLV